MKEFKGSSVEVNQTEEQKKKISRKDEQRLRGSRTHQYPCNGVPKGEERQRDREKHSKVQ